MKIEEGPGPTVNPEALSRMFSKLSEKDIRMLTENRAPDIKQSDFYYVLPDKPPKRLTPRNPVAQIPNNLSPEVTNG